MAWWTVTRTVMTILALILLLQLRRNCEALKREKFVVQPHPVQFNEEPHNWTVTEGASVNLTCNTTVVQVIGYIDENTTPLPQIKWFHNNVMIVSSGHFTINNYGIDTSILTIRNVTSLEQGEYYCVVNEWVKPDGDWWTKTRSKSGHITVISNNSILSVNTENHVILSCVEPTAVVPSSGVVWTKDGVEMSENVIDPYGNILLYRAREDNSGYYQCIDRVNNNTLLSYHVVVNTKDNEFLHRPQLSTDLYQDTQFIIIKTNPIGSCSGSPANQSVMINCNISGHTAVSWYKNGELLDLNSEGTMFNQTTGDLVIRREDACELLGVYQCFASNEIDTVHVSTRVLPLGWPNHPGRPELISYSSHSNGFTLEVKLYQPDYLGGLTAEDGLRYDIYRAFAGNTNINNNNENIYIEDVDASNTSTVVSIELNSDVLITGPSSLWSVHYFTVQIKISNRSLIEIAALPEGSPFLKVDVWCDLIDFSVPVVEETCHYNSTSDLVTHNISWYMKGTQGGVTYRINDIGNWLWYISGGCNYSNGTSVGKPYVNQVTNAKYVVWRLPRNISCRVSIRYDTSCRAGNSSYNQPCSYINAADLPDDDDDGNSTHLSPEDDESIPMILVVTISSTLVLMIVIITLCICYRRYLRHKPSAIKMLENAEKLKKLQMSCPISDDQHSVITTQTASELYTEKVNRWMERLEDITEIDSDSVFEFDAEEMLDQIVTGRVTCTQANTPSHYIDYKSLRCNSKKIPTLPLSPTSVASRSYTRKGILPSIATADSGVESSTEMDWNSPYTDFNSDVLQLYHSPIKALKMHSTLANHNSYNGLDDRTPEYDRLKVSDESDLERPRVIRSYSKFNDHIIFESTEKIGDYVGLEVAHQGHCASESTERNDDQVSIEMTDQEDCVPESTQKFGEYIESDTVDQSHCHQVTDDGYLRSDNETYDYFSDEVMIGSHETAESHEIEEEPNYNDYITSSMVNDDCNDIVVVAT